MELSTFVAILLLKRFFMKKENYSVPLCEVLKTKLRASLLTGSTPKTGVSGHDFEFETRERKVDMPSEVKSID